MVERLIRIENKNCSLDIFCNYKPGKLLNSVGVVCLHGLQSNKAAFSSVAELCARNNFSFLAFDFVGFGDSEKPEDFSYDLVEQAAIAGKVIERFFPDKFFLIGHSMGGMVGTLLLESMSEKILGFINMEGNFVLEDCGASLPASQVTFAEFSQMFFPDLKNSLGRSCELSAGKRRIWLEKTSEQAFYKTSLSIVELSGSASLVSLFIDAPVKKLFLYGDKNKRKASVLPASISKIEISDAGHFMLLDNQKETLKVIANFLCDN